MTDVWRVYAIHAIEDARTAARWVSREAADEILASAEFTLKNFSSPPVWDSETRRYPKRFLVRS